MTHADYRMACEYTAQHGPLSPMRMYDRPAALIAFYLKLYSGGSPKSLSEFMPFQQPSDTINFED